MPEQPLVCVECDQPAPPEARGWRAFLTVDDEVAVYCPGVRAAGVRRVAAC